MNCAARLILRKQKYDDVTPLLIELHNGFLLVSALFLKMDLK